MIYCIGTCAYFIFVCLSFSSFPEIFPNFVGSTLFSITLFHFLVIRNPFFSFSFSHFLAFHLFFATWGAGLPPLCDSLPSLSLFFFGPDSSLLGRLASPAHTSSPLSPPPSLTGGAYPSSSTSDRVHTTASTSLLTSRGRGCSPILFSLEIMLQSLSLRSLDFCRRPQPVSLRSSKPLRPTPRAAPSVQCPLGQFLESSSVGWVLLR